MRERPIYAPPHMMNRGLRLVLQTRPDYSSPDWVLVHRPACSCTGLLHQTRYRAQLALHYDLRLHRAGLES